MNPWIIRISFDIVERDGKKLVMGVRRFQNEGGCKTIYTGMLSPPEDPVVKDGSLLKYAEKYAVWRGLEVVSCPEKPNVFLFYR